ncbi:MAG: CapA family protein [Bacillota bacterium]|nr:CapA family protein [Bacillota bacterium]
MAKSTKKRKKRRIRYDRILILIVSFILLIALFIGAIRFVMKLIIPSKSNSEETITEVSSSKKENKPIDENTISLVAVGDNLIHETVYLDAQQADGSYDFKKMYSHIQDKVKQADIAFINQETVLGGTELGLTGYPTFNSPTEIAQNLEDVGFNLANLASNHCLDEHETGIINELEAFDQTNIVVDGVYDSQTRFDTIPTFDVKGVTFSFLAYTYGTNGVIPPNSYNVSYFDEEQIIEDVERAKEMSDVVIVSAHWGDENTFAPNSFQEEYAQLFADLGVDLVIGTHPHTIQPIEWIEGENGNKTLVAYSLGNFLGGMLTTDNAIGGMFCVDFKKNGDSVSIENVEWKPTIIHFEGDQDDILNSRCNYATYFVSDYSAELAKNHVLNGYDGNVVSLDYINEVTNDVIDSQYLK